MNERIKELFNKASVYAYGQNPGENSYGRPVDENKYEEDRYTKFAELIVRDCMMICGAIQGAGEVRDMSDFASGAAQCRAIIKRDFGIQE